MRDVVQPGVSAPALLLSTDKITASHRARDAYVYVRQSTPSQMVQHTESLARQYELRERAVALGWPAHQVVVIDADLGRSGAQAEGRRGFKELVADVGLGRVGIVLGIEVSRLARNNADWYQLLDLCAITDTLIADADGVYHPVRHTCIRPHRCLRGRRTSANKHFVCPCSGRRHFGAREFTVQETAFRRVSRRTPKVVELQRLSLYVPTRITVYVASRDNAVTTSTHGVHYESN